jgi:hypothetical protein
MRSLIFVAVLCAAGCAGQPRTVAPAIADTAAPSGEAAKPVAKRKMVPERVKGAYRMVEKNGEKRYCRKELATGSHVNYRTICLTTEEYEQIGERDQSALRDALRGPVNSATLPGGP